MSEMKPGLLEEFSEIVAATRSLLEADQARGVRGYQRLSRSQLRAAVAETAPIEEAHGELSVEHPPQEMVPQANESMASASSENALRVAVLESPDRADVLVVGGVCSTTELSANQPFLGEGGAMLEKMLTHVLGVERNGVGLMMRRPSDQGHPGGYSEAVSAAVRTVQPRLILTMGDVALSAVQHQVGKGKAQLGQWHAFEGIPLLPTMDPEHLLQRPADKRTVFAHLKSFRARMDALGAK